jgi:hypothetical protein
MDKDARRDAKKLFEQAEQAFTRGDYQMAYLLFEQVEAHSDGDLQQQAQLSKSHIKIGTDAIYAGVMATLVYVVAWLLVLR